MDNQYDKVEALTFREAFQLTSPIQKRAAFEKIDIGEMTRALDAQRIAVDGKEVFGKRYNEKGQRLDNSTYHSIFETYKVDFRPALANITKQDKPQWRYAVKCWCTSTNKGHWIWIDERYAHQL